MELSSSSSSFHINPNFAEVRYRLGLETEPEDENIAKTWYLRAAKHHHPIAQYLQSQMMAETSHPTSMLALFKSAENGYDEGTFNPSLALVEVDIYDVTYDL